MGKETVLHLNRGPKPLESFSSKHAPEFTTVGFSEGFEVMERDLSRNKGLFGSHTIVERVEVSGGVVYSHELVKRPDAFEKTRLGELISRLSSLRTRGQA